MCKILAKTKDMSKEDWLQLRKQGIGGSDVGSICGLNPYKSVKVIDPDKISGRFAFGDIQNKRMLVCTDMSADRISKQTVAKFKQISGDKYIRCEQKRVPESTEEVTFKLLLCTNSGIYLPLGEESGSFYRRIIVLPFVKSTPLAEIDKVKMIDAKSWLVSLQEGGKRFSTVRTIRRVLRPAFRLAVDDDLIRKNPFDFP